MTSGEPGAIDGQNGRPGGRLLVEQLIRRLDVPRVRSASGLGSRLAIGLLVLGGAAGVAGCPGSEAGGGATGTAISGPDAIDDEAFDEALKAAEEYIHSGDRDAAESILATALTRRPDEPRASELLGRVLMGRANSARSEGLTAISDAQRAEAWTYYRIAAAGRPDDAGLQTSAGLIGMTAGDNDGAMVCFERAEAADPSAVQAPLYLGQIHLGASRSEEAAAAFERVLALDPDEPYALSSLAVARMNLGDLDRAIELAAEARSIAPRDAGIRLIEARVLRGAGRAEESLRRLLALPADVRLGFAMTAEIAAAELALDRPAAAAKTWGAAWAALPAGPERGAAADGAARAWTAAGASEEAWNWVGRARGERTRREISDLESHVRNTFGDAPPS
ncbi:MAG: tetratricopeptide repeat protein [Phycisphaerales bacterium]